MTSDYVGWLLSSTLSTEYMNSYPVGMFAKYLQAGRADNLQGVINLTSKRSGDIAVDVRKIRHFADSRHKHEYSAAESDQPSKFGGWFFCPLL